MSPFGPRIFNVNAKFPWMVDDDAAAELSLRCPAFTPGALDTFQIGVAEEMRKRIVDGKCGVVLGADVGTGKTRAAIRALTMIGGLVLVLLPAQVVMQWESELAVLFGSGKETVSWLRHKGAPAVRKARLQAYLNTDGATDAKVVLTTYGMVIKDFAELKAVQWSTIVIDEVHTMKNKETRWAQSLHAMPCPKIGLTATPSVGDARVDLLGILHSIDPTSPLLRSKTVTVSDIACRHVIALSKEDVGQLEIAVRHTYKYVSFSEEELDGYQLLLRRLTSAHSMFVQTLTLHVRNPRRMQATLMYKVALANLRRGSVYPIERYKQAQRAHARASTEQRSAHCK